ncbi:MAG TPA: hypothetical protein VH813_10555 [Candidatus Limnocylindrales bacterium]
MGSVAVRAIVTVGVLIAVTACGPTQPSPSASASPSIVVAPSATVSAPPTPGRTSSPAVVHHAGPLATAGSVVVLGSDGSLSLVDAAGDSVLVASAEEGTFFLPAWSPDGSKIAAVRFGSEERRILVFDALAPTADPVEIFRSSVVGPFYLSWTPDGRSVSFLADEAGSLSLRIAPADGSAPLDGTGPGATIRTGSPLYFDWIEPDRLLAHVGIGPDALLGEIGIDGAPSSPALASAGEFRSAVVSPDQRFVGYVRARGGTSEIVVSARDRSTEHAIPVFGLAAVAFDPTSDTLASIGPAERASEPIGIPAGPLRLLDAESGRALTLLDGSVLSFWWSPDGKTIAALRLQPVGGAAASASPPPSPSAPRQEVRLLFVDVASGDVGAQVVVQPGRLFIEQLLSYFDQYALSHELWAPDSSSILIPIVNGDGTTSIAVTYRNGDPPATIEGAIAFWSPSATGG